MTSQALADSSSRLKSHMAVFAASQDMVLARGMLDILPRVFAYRAFLGAAPVNHLLDKANE